MRAGLIDDLAYEDELDDKVKLVAGQAALHRHGGIPAGQRRQPRSRSRPAHRGHLRLRAHRVGPSSYDSPGGRRSSGPTRINRVPAQGARRQLGQGDRPADRQPRRIGDRVRHHLARGAADQEPQAAHRVDVRRRGVGRLLHRDAGARDRRRAVNAHGIDRRRAHQVRDRRHAEEARA